MPSSETIRRRTEAARRRREAQEAEGESQGLFNGAFSAPSAGGSGETSQERQRRLRREGQQSQQEARRAREQAARELQTGFELGSVLQPTSNISDQSILRYPKQALGGGNITSESDYVLFEFYKYAPPFRAQRSDANYTSNTPAVSYTHLRAHET